ncbi:hypothetical protein [Uliginosibacterium gangwonense]|uniref:hypothetical protein n=1 Tax=Uliginosibacterium gangwonense TaxID=392736 RepID=UPI000A011615|nr:hypothetical protein [Uliginosibacterium gangwonense]
MKSLCILVLVTTCGVIGLTGCVATTTPRTDAQLGEALSLIKAQQVLDPMASRNTAPVSGMDGKSAKGAMERYHESFTKPSGEPSTPSFMIGVGTGTSAK